MTYTHYVPPETEIFTLQEISLPHLPVTQHHANCTQDLTTMHHAVYINDTQICVLSVQVFTGSERDNELMHKT